MDNFEKAESEYNRLYGPYDFNEYCEGCQYPEEICICQGNDGKA